MGFHLVPVITRMEFGLSKFIFCCSTDTKGIFKNVAKDGNTANSGSKHEGKIQLFGYFDGQAVQ